MQVKRLVEQLRVLEPFGKGNEKPVFADRKLTVRSANMIGKNKNVLKMQLEDTQDTLLMQFSLRLKKKICRFAEKKSPLCITRILMNSGEIRHYSLSFRNGAIQLDIA